MDDKTPKNCEETVMLDGGERVTYEGGAKREPHKGKGRYDWITPFGLERTTAAGVELAKWRDERKVELGAAGELSTASYFINCWRKGRRDRDFLALAAWMVASAMHFEATGELMKPGYGFLNFSPYALERLAKWYEKGGEKYNHDGIERNWEQGMPWDHPLDSALRHINCWRKGLKEEDNLAAVLWNLFALMHYECCHMDKFDNIPRYPEARKKHVHLSTADRNKTEKYLKVQGYFAEKEEHPWTIVEDFDGTLCNGAWPEIGEPNWEEIAYILKRQKEGAKIILATCREGDKLDAAVAWCAEKGIVFDAVNENLQGHCTRFGGDSRKIYGDEYRDDKAVRVTFGEKARIYDYKALLKPEERDDLKNAKQFLDEMKREDRESDRFMLRWAKAIIEAQTETIDRLTEEQK